MSPGLRRQRQGDLPWGSLLPPTAGGRTQGKTQGRPSFVRLPRKSYLALFLDALPPSSRRQGVAANRASHNQ
eukprot:1156835-Pelagomonas_calceolata.AAC.4